MTRSAAAVDWSALVPADARVALLVGDVAPEVIDRIRRRNPAAFLVGVGASPDADGRLDRRIDAHLAAFGPATPGLAPGSVDCLAIGLPLDSIADPTPILGAAVRLLSGDGVVLAIVDGEREVHPMLDRAGLEVVDADALAGPVPPFVVGDGGPSRGPVVVRGVRRGRRPTPLLVQTLAATPICSRVRTEEPDALLRAIPGVRTRTDYGFSPFLEGRPGEVRVFIRQRHLLGEADLDLQRALIERGFLIVAEWDDDPSIFPAVVANDYLTVRACHCVQVSTEPLAEVLRPYNPHVAVFPNRLFELPPPRPPRAGWPLSIVFGALNREADWPGLVPGLQRVLDEYGGRVRVEVVHDRRFFDALRGASRTFHPFLPYPAYVEVLRRSDVALLPLSERRFNACKSDLKFLECAAHGVACLASPTVYGSSIRHGETGLIYRSPAEFEASLRRLIAEPALRSSLIAAAYREVARHRMLGPVVRDRRRWYLDMGGRLPALTAELRGRVPALR